MKEINSYEDALLWSPTKKERLKQESVWTAGASIVCRILAAETQTSVMRMFTEWMAFTSLSQIQKMRKMGKKTMVKVGGMAGVSMNVWWAVVCGAVGGVLIGLITEYYTGGAPVQKIAESGETGSATVTLIFFFSIGIINFCPIIQINYLTT